MLVRAHIFIVVGAILGNLGATIAQVNPCGRAERALPIAAPEVGFVELGNTLATHGDVVALGDTKHFTETDQYWGSGAVVVYRRGSGVWTTEQVIEAPFRGTYDNGASPAMFGMRIVLVDDWLIASDRGGLWFFERVESGGTSAWVRRGDQWPISSIRLSFATDGEQVAIGTIDGVYIASRDATQARGWQIARLVAAGAGGSDSRSVAMRGELLAVWRNTQVQVFRKQEGQWLYDTAFQAGITAASRWTLVTDGQRIAIGVGQSIDTPSSEGEAVVFVRSRSGGWLVEARLSHPAPESTQVQSAFAHSLDLSGDRLVIGSHLDDRSGTDAGALYAYRLIGGQWRAVGTIAGEGEDQEQLGWRVALGANGVIATYSGYAGAQGGVEYSLCALGLADVTARKCWPGIVGLYYFVDEYLSQSDVADFNGDGAVTISDLLEYFGAWLTGCSDF